MGKARLLPEERDRRARERAARTWSGANYNTYDTSGGFGSAKDWTGSAKGRFGTINPHLKVLGLDEMPTTKIALKKAFKIAMKTAHPDLGGTDDKAREVIEAYEILGASLSG